MPFVTPKKDTVLISATSDQCIPFTLKDGALGGTLYPGLEIKDFIIKLAGNHSGRGLKAGERWTGTLEDWNVPPNAITPVVITPSRDSERRPYLPIDEEIDWLNPNCKISQYFTVLEVTKGDTERIPQSNTVISNVITLAKQLDRVRAQWGSPIGVTSWYRPPAVNAMVGGVSNSQHINGSAVDVYTMDGRDWAFEDFLDKHWGGALGYGVSSGRGFTHLDLRGGGWEYGNGSIRWNY